MQTDELGAILESVKLLQLKPGDALIFRIDTPLSDEVSARIKEHVSKLLPGWPILVLDPHVEVEVARRTDALAA